MDTANMLKYMVMDFVMKHDKTTTFNEFRQNKYYENAETVSKSLAFIMKTQLIKRLESSFYAFKKSLGNFQSQSLHCYRLQLLQYLAKLSVLQPNSHLEI